MEPCSCGAMTSGVTVRTLASQPRGAEEGTTFLLTKRGVLDANSARYYASIKSGTVELTAALKKFGTRSDALVL
ncbi:hypothetical protein CHELA40_50758 [Chelatococcus asaccharovorans]|nr:hypothetical protein CHELA17_20724 [Chelatococcus asaccharovorans]CAH1694169.1 hypothetical protein CHELA40_50758 [Chelatococcus asaccharovorans]